jgi:hypothetical protein
MLCDKCNIPLDKSGTCPSCGVFHGEECPSCSRCGYHSAECEDYQEAKLVNCNSCRCSPCACADV